MSWTTADGGHEAYLAAEFADGQRATGSSGGGVPDDQIIVATEYDGEPGAITSARHTTRPAAEVIGWRVVCNCYDTSSVTKTWVSDLLVRVPSATLEDVRAGRIYAADGDVVDVDFRDDVAAMATGRWHREHLDGPQALGRIRDARGRVAAAERELHEAVRDARAAGESWEAIGRAAGITRQTAHQRWAGLGGLSPLGGLDWRPTPAGAEETEQGC